MKSTILLALVATALPALAGSGKAPAPVAPPAPEASSISYDFIGAGWTRELDGFNLSEVGLGSSDVDGYNINLSKTIAGGLFGFASFGQGFGDTSVSVFGNDLTVDLETLSAAVGVGYHVGVASNVDFVVQVGGAYADADVSASVGGFTASVRAREEFGAIAAVGFRAALTNWLELNLFYTPSYFEDSDFANAGTANIIFRNIVSTVDLVLSGSINEETESFGAGLRYNF